MGLPEKLMYRRLEKLERGCRMTHAGVPSSVWGWRTAMFQLSGCYCTQRLRCSSFWAVYILMSKRKIGHNQKGTTLEPLGRHYDPLRMNSAKLLGASFELRPGAGICAVASSLRVLHAICAANDDPILL